MFTYHKLINTINSFNCVADLQLAASRRLARYVFLSAESVSQLGVSRKQGNQNYNNNYNYNGVPGPAGGGRKRTVPAHTHGRHTQGREKRRPST